MYKSLFDQILEEANQLAVPSQSSVLTKIKLETTDTEVKITLDVSKQTAKKITAEVILKDHIKLIYKDEKSTHTEVIWLRSDINPDSLIGAYTDNGLELTISKLLPKQNKVFKL